MPSADFWQNLKDWNGPQLLVVLVIVVLALSFGFLLKFTAPGVTRFEARRTDRNAERQDALGILQDQVKALTEEVAELRRHVEHLERRDRHHVQVDAARVGREHLLARECDARREFVLQILERWGEGVPTDITREAAALQDAAKVAAAIPLPQPPREAVPAST